MRVVPRATAVLLAAFVVGGCGLSSEARRSGATADADKQFDVRVSGLTFDEAVAGMLYSLGGATNRLQGEAGMKVIVHLRRDAVGLAGPTPAGLDYGGPLRSALQVRGTLVKGPPGWIVLDTDDGRRLHLPVEQVLAVETALPEATTTRPG